MAKKKPEGRSPRERALDDLVMSTNSSSIVSKRSVERIYYPDEPHFFRFFVKKFQRRSPLINRGYHIRLHVIDVAVRNFLRKPSLKRKVVINLGAGFDVLPWQCMTRYPDSCKNARFIDIDFPDLMEKKRKVIQETTELNSMLTRLDVSKDPLVFLQSDEYIQMGCDLRDLDKIQQSISQLVDLEDCEFIFVAEVSITYMETVAADAVIKWANSLGQAEFCLLEQILPDGAEHPFAETMLRHFEKLKTPLKSVLAYPTLQSQRDRFTHLGWSNVHVETLWSAWSSATYLTTEDRKKLNGIEPFDEWEEFAVFGGHYCVVSATNRLKQSQGQTECAADSLAQSSSNLPSVEVETEFGETPRTCQRRFGASMLLQDYTGQEYAANLFGLGNTSRLSSVDLYGQDSATVDMKPTGPPSRMCHTVVDLGLHGNILIGGRASPSAPLKDSWVFDKVRKSWRKDRDLPVPLYRHATTRLGHSSLALTIGGKTGPSTVYEGCLLYVPDKGWLECEILGQPHAPVFGAVVVSITGNRSSAFGGILLGGLLEDGVLARQYLRWNLSITNLEKPTICFSPITAQDEQYGLLDRFGATAVAYKPGRLVIIGGIVKGQVLDHSHEILLVGISDESLSIVSTCQIDVSSTLPRPVLLGISTVQDAQGRVLLTGGGATCFSMGTYWNNGYYVLGFNDGYTGTLPAPVEQLPKWTFAQTLELTSTPVQYRTADSSARDGRPEVQTLPRVKLASSAEFDKILKAGQPVVIEKANLGSSVSTWTPEYLVSKIGRGRSVVVHESTTAKMDFNSKNFKYVTKEFGSFVDEVQKGGRMYLRALSEEKPADRPANLAEDFPSLAEDFVLPPEVSFVADNTFSSVLRISGSVNMWLHYDVMANIYCQIAGTKRLVLFPPADVTELSFAPGASSSSLDVFAELDTASLANTRPHEAILEPGDILFLPPLWLHTAAPVSGLGIAVNVFFRNLEGGYSAGRDVYGNRDLAAYEKGRQDVTKMASAFGKVPVEIREFYVKRLASELLQKLHE
ncbi:hypothetical protein PFICI_07318 [Pestalotiopsis fici W106-1]|uniref:tRNA wybutosine-synthesizing protein 4 n=1 Tax=Pestalotiopsis fici (strain W106-1 / CGMCC3.15140) TaxID=1229662 RepID=W3XAX7_PESFW|nr:uncharacterized protein PFICI_07318 [Pestalotiopsis fici W106-1]ETS82316.1 hypothetical protein PFICI_07318 [Pestalotiopsis fici W106-1]